VGIGFAIPADTAEAITRQLMTGGKITRGYIGATIQPFTEEMAETQGLSGTQGAIVADLTAGGPAETAGLRRGDVVTSVNGVAIKDSTGLTREVAKARPGETIRMDVLRDGRRQTVNIRSGVRPSESELAANDNGSPRAPGSPARPGAPATQQVLGLQVSGIDAAARTRFSLPSTVNGVVVESVRQGSDAAEKGLRRGDVITSINQRPVTTAAEMSAAIEAAKRGQRTSVLAGFFRSGRYGYLPLKIE
jgi:serine protease Do